jgi:hypothetical protein
LPLYAGKTHDIPPILTKPFISGSFFKLTHYPLLAQEQKRNYVLGMFQKEAGMLRVFVEEAAALASIGLFVGMVAIWAQLFSQL